MGKEASGLAEQGFSVALSADGSTALIGAPEDAGEGEAYYGAAFVFTREGTTWHEQQKLVAKTGGATTKGAQGESVSLSAGGNIALVGAYDNEYPTGVGAAFVFTRSGSKWTQEGGALVGKHGAGVVQEGTSVALAGDGATALIGGPREEGPGSTKEEGAAWVFTESGGTWSEQAELPPGTGAGGETGAGQSVALSGDGNTALVGGPGFDEDLGAAWVYVRSGSSWSQQGELQGEDASTKPQQGHSVSLSESGDAALVGGYHDDDSVGAAWAYERGGSTWGEQEKLMGTGSSLAFPTQGTGVALSADGSTALVGGGGDDGGVGAAWVFTRTAPSSGGSPETNPPSGGNTSTGTNNSTNNASSSTSGIATTAKGIEELELGCSHSELVLNDAYIRDGRVALEGSAAKALVGRKVKILFNERRQVATATVRADGQFATTAPLPPARIREALSTRYSAEIGKVRSLHLKLTRRLLLEPPQARGKTVTLSGRIALPLTKPIAPVVVEQQLECGRTTIARRFTPPASGRFHITVTVPAAARAGIYQLKSKVAANSHATRHGFTTYSLPLPVALG